jgi:hypothetical protein
MLSDKPTNRCKIYLVLASFLKLSFKKRAPTFGQWTQHQRSSYSTSSMSTHVYMNARLAYGFGKTIARLYQRLFMLFSSPGYINYQNINVLFISTLLISTYNINPLNQLFQNNTFWFRLG